MLVLPREELEITDTADHAIDPMADNAIEEVVIIGRRGPAQAAFTNPELLELGELTQADVIVDPAEVELDDHSARSIEGEGEITPRRNVEILTELLAPRARGQAQAGGPALPALARWRSRGRQGGGDRARAQRARARQRRPPARPGHRRARDAGGRAGVPLDRIPRRPDRGGAVRRVARRGPERGGPRDRPARAARHPRRVRGRLDQARALRRDRHQQARRAGDRGSRPRGSIRGPPARADRRRSGGRRGARRESASPTSCPMRAGRRSTPWRRRPASPRAARGSSSRASRRCWTRHGVPRRAPANRPAQGTERSAETDSPSSASSARSTGAEMQVKIGVSDSV